MDPLDSTVSNMSTTGRQRSGTVTQPPVQATIWNAVEPHIVYDHDEPNFLPQGADFYELLSGLVRTEDGTDRWTSYFPHEVLKWPETKSHEDTLLQMKSKMASADSGAGGDLWDDLV